MKTYALEIDRFFAIKADIPVTDSNNIIQIQIKYDIAKIDPKRFGIKYRIDDGIVFPEKIKPSTINLFPLSKIATLKIITERPKTNLEIQITDTKTGRVYKSNVLQIWNSQELNSYIQRLNKQMIK